MREQVPSDVVVKKLSRIVPAHRLTVSFDWVTPFQKHGAFRSVRERHGQSVQTNCFWCNYKFEPDDLTYLAHPKSKKNTFLCWECAVKVDPKCPKYRATNE